MDNGGKSDFSSGCWYRRGLSWAPVNQTLRIEGDSHGLDLQVESNENPPPLGIGGGLCESLRRGPSPAGELHQAHKCHLARSPHGCCPAGLDFSLPHNPRG